MIILIMSQNVPDTAQTISKTKTSDSTGGTGGLKENSQSAFDKTSTGFISEVKSLKGFKIAALGPLNITSLTKHIDELKVVMLNQPFDILAINETRLDSSITNAEIALVDLRY
jgi:hypothetical protein